jgi:hypothetical protein
MRLLSRIPFVLLSVDRLVCYTTFITAVEAMTVPSHPNLTTISDWDNIGKQTTGSTFHQSLDNRNNFLLSLARGGDLVIRSKRRYGNIGGVHVICASVVVLALPGFTLQVLQIAAVTILVSSILQYTVQKGFL